MVNFLIDCHLLLDCHALCGARNEGSGDALFILKFIILCYYNNIFTTKVEVCMKFIRFFLFLLVLLQPVVGEAAVHKHQEKQVPHLQQEITLSYGPVVKNVAPAVVNIYTIQHMKVKLPSSPFLKDPFFKQFFERLHPSYGQEQIALGSGVIVNKEGYVLTNYHVVENADAIQVILSDKREFLAKLITMDKRSDLALLKIESKETFPYLEVKAHDDLEVGDVVLAIGNPFGVGQTVTHGIISALARSQEGISDFRSFIQTDAAINPGNSGGALVTTNGRLVGINTAIYSKSGGSVGIGFAIPTTLAIPVINSINNGGEVIRPWLGIEAVPQTMKLLKSLGLSRPTGVVVDSVYPDGPAQKAGLIAGDIITALDGIKIEDEAALEYQIAISPVGKQAILHILRQGEVKKLPVQLTEPTQGKDPRPFTVEGKNPLQGVKMRVLSPALAIKMALNPMKEGIVITEVTPGIAEKMGLLPGDILLSIDEQKIRSKKDIFTLLKKNKGVSNLTVLRGSKVIKYDVKSA